MDIQRWTFLNAARTIRELPARPQGHRHSLNDDLLKPRRRWNIHFKFRYKPTPRPVEQLLRGLHFLQPQPSQNNKRKNVRNRKRQVFTTCAAPLHKADPNMPFWLVLPIQFERPHFPEARRDVGLGDAPLPPPSALLFGPASHDRQDQAALHLVARLTRPIHDYSTWGNLKLR